MTDEISVVVANADQYNELRLSVWVDLIPNAGSLGGIYTALINTTSTQALILAGDMPFVILSFLEHLMKISKEVDVVIPRTNDGYHPLCACYRRSCVPVIQRQIWRGDLKVTDWLSEISVHEVGPEEIKHFTPEGHLLFNVNAEEDYQTCIKILSSKNE